MSRTVSIQSFDELMAILLVQIMMIIIIIIYEISSNNATTLKSKRAQIEHDNFLLKIHNFESH